MKDKVCIVTGASRGIGRRLAVDLARDGAIVTLVARPSARLGEALAEARRWDPRAAALECDVTDQAAVARMVAGVAGAHGRIDVVVNNAGIEPIGTVAETPVEVIEQTLRTNFLGMVYCVKAVLPIMQRDRRGAIVNMTSSAAWFPLPRGAAYCASKAAIRAFSESLYNEVRTHGIQVLLVYPGFVPETDMAQAHMAARGTPPRFVHQSLDQVSRAVRGAIGTDAFQVVLPRLLALTPVVKELFPALSLRRAATMQG